MQPKKLTFPVIFWQYVKAHIQKCANTKICHIISVILISAVCISSLSYTWYYVSDKKDTAVILMCALLGIMTYIGILTVILAFYQIARTICNIKLNQ